MIDIVIPLGTGSRHENMELKYALRGIEKHLSNVREVYIIGENPGFKNIIHISKNESHRSAHKERNCYEKLLIACNTTEISENFLYFNDDHFLLRDFDAATFPNHYKDNLKESYSLKTGSYKISVRNTLRALQERKLPLLDFDCHCPILINKRQFKEHLPTFDWNKGYGYLIKSLYGNSVGLCGEKYPDMKIQAPQTIEWLNTNVLHRPYFSIGDGAIWSDLVNFLDNLYPNPSKYEQ